MDKIDVGLRLLLVAILFWFAYQIRIELKMIADLHIKEAIINTVWFGIMVVFLNNTNK